MILQVGVKVILRNSEGKYFLQKRSPVKYAGVKGNWDIPGGRIEPGTALLDNIRREVKEETNLEVVGEPKLIAAQDILRPDKHVVRLTYAGEASGTVTLDTGENIEFRWLTLEEAKNMDDLDIYLKEVLETYEPS